MQKHEVLIAMLIAASLALAAWFGLSEALGAHPWWAVRTGAVGAPIGAVVYLLARVTGFRPTALCAVAAIALILATASAILGKDVFARSLAENALAGKFWFFGWFGIFAGLAAFLTASIVCLRR